MDQRADSPHRGLGSEMDTPTLAMTISIPRASRKVRLDIPTLRVVAGKDMLRFVPIGLEQEVIFGRDEDCDFVLDDASVSRKHAKVSRTSKGEIFVQDLGSTNGTAVNGQPIERVLLRAGDHVEFGAVGLRLDILGTEELRHLERVREKLKDGSLDSLTGLKTRGVFEDEVPELLVQADANKTSISAIFMDIDWFKGVNDRFGHQIGDEVLRDFGRLMLLGMRDSDLGVRYGGEEIVLILPSTPLEDALAIAERIRLTIASHDWSRTAEGLAVTASLGVVERRESEALRDWIERADRALYAAKAAGRNRVVSS